MVRISFVRDRLRLRLLLVELELGLGFGDHIEACVRNSDAGAVEGLTLTLIIAEVVGWWPALP